MSEWTPLLSGIVGSTAHGLAGPDSDVDRLTVAAAPTTDFHGLTPPMGRKASLQRHDPDVTVHEAGKFVALAMQCNPSAIEVLFLPSVLVEVRTDLGEELVGLRTRLLSAHAVKSAYLGYATQQFRRLENRGKFPNVPADRIRKHARHIFRLVEQGTQLWVSGDYDVRVRSPQMVRIFAERVLAEPQVARSMLARAEYTFTTLPTPLPAVPDRVAAERWLLKVRAEHYDGWEAA